MYIAIIVIVQDNEHMIEVWGLYVMLCDIYIVCTCNLEENKCTLYMCFCVYSVITTYIVFVFNQERLIVWFCIFTIGDPIITWGRVRIPLTGLPLPLLCAFPNPGAGFPMAYVMVFSMFNELRQELIVHFVDIDGIIDHHCLKHSFRNLM